MPRPKGTEPQRDMETEILTTAWRQIGAKGAAALSLRAIARELGITAPAIYNYFPSRDDLVTALIVDAYRSFGDSQKAGIAHLPPEKHAERLLGLGQAYREWAVTYPERYQLIFGTPIAGYTAPQEVTMPVAAWALDVLIGVLASAADARALHVPQPVPMSPKLQAMFAAWQEARGAMDPEILYLALSIWSRAHGLVSLEIGHQFPLFITDARELYHRELQLIVNQYIEAKAES